MLDFTNGVNPNQLYMSTGEATKFLGIDRNQLRSLLIKKELEWDRVAGHTMLYRSSVLAYKDRVENAGRVPNRYAKTPEAGHAA